MMTKKLFSLFVLGTLVFTSCKKELEPQDSAETPVATTENPTMDPAQTVNMTAPQSTPVTIPSAVQTQPGINPPHGQPGHDCAVAVGAPLNSKKTTPTPSPTYTTTQSNTPAAAPAILNPAAQTATAPGMNPPHGQAGHDCAVAVGAPLPKS